MIDKKYMKRAIRLAKKGEGWVNPNPLVGAVIVKDGRIIGEGFHEKYGQLHAERNAIASLKESAKGADIYVTLEPCCHHGKTPPCTEAIIEAGISRVIVGSADPNVKVAGGGIKALREAKIEVITDFLKEECDDLNPAFFHFITRHTPYVTLKYAMTMDGKIATKTGASKWITGEMARAHVQKIRHKNMAIMTGIGTVLADDPMMNARVKNPNNPIRVICDSKLRLPFSSQMVRTAKDQRTIVVSAFDLNEEEDVYKFEKRKSLLTSSGVEVVNFRNIAGQVDLAMLMEYLGGEGIDSVLLEGGATLNESAMRAGIVNEVLAYMAPKIFGGPGKSPVDGMGVERPDEAYMFEHRETKTLGSDIVMRFVSLD